MKYYERKYFSIEEKRIFLNKTDCKCAHCGKTLNEETMTIDHIFPISKGGDNNEYNILPLCEKCNYIKSNYVYNLYDFYFFIKDEYYSQFAKHFNKFIEEYRKGKMFSVDAFIVYSRSNNIKKICNNMAKRGVSKNKINDIWNNTKFMIKLFFERAYPADAEEAFNVIKENNKDTNILGKCTHYKNPLELRIDIEDGDVYVLRDSSRKIYGVFAFTKFPKKEISSPQLQNVCDELNFKAKWILSGVALNKYHDVFNQIMVQIFDCFIVNKYVPLFYEAIKETMVDDKNDYLLVHCSEFDKEDNIVFRSVKYIRKYVKDWIKRTIENEEYNISEEEYDELVELSFTNKGFTNRSEKLLNYIEKYPKLDSVFK